MLMLAVMFSCLHGRMLSLCPGHQLRFFIDTRRSLVVTHGFWCKLSHSESANGSLHSCNLFDDTATWITLVSPTANTWIGLVNAASDLLFFGFWVLRLVSV